MHHGFVMNHSMLIAEFLIQLNLADLHNLSTKESSQILVCGLRKRMSESEIGETFKTLVNVKQVRILEPGKACLLLESQNDAGLVAKILNGTFVLLRVLNLYLLFPNKWLFMPKIIIIYI